MYEKMKNETITEDNIVFDDKHYRYINHDEGIVTVGFGTKGGLIKYKDIIRFDFRTMITMRFRYEKIIAHSESLRAEKEKAGNRKIIDCPYCDNWIEINLDEPRNKIPTFPLHSWVEENISIHQCEECGSPLALNWEK